MKRTNRLFLSFLFIGAVAINVQAATQQQNDNGNTAVGQDALSSITTGGYNAGVGWRTLNVLRTNNYNTAVGAGTLALKNADSNTAVGTAALLLNTEGTGNTATGAFALANNATGFDNSAFGESALSLNVDGFENSVFGQGAMAGNTVGNDNTVIGFQALNNNSSRGAPGVNTAIGFQALLNSNDESASTAVGASALVNNTNGNYNTALGWAALRNNVSGSANLALGAGAGSNVVDADNVICIGHDVAGANLSNTTWIGNIYGVTTVSGTTAPVVVSGDDPHAGPGNQLGIMASSERFKKDIASMEKSSDAILSLRPVTFHYKTDIKGTPQFGLIAEEVAKVNPELVLLDKEGKPLTVRYDAVNTMLLNEFLKEHEKVEKLEGTIAQQDKDFEAAVAELKRQIQKVSAQLEASKPAPQVVNNP